MIHEEQRILRNAVQEVNKQSVLYPSTEMNSS